MSNPYDAHETEEVDPPIAAKARDLEALRTAVVDAATVGAGLWFSYIFVLLYLGIAVGSVTHRDLFFANPVKLPFLGVDLPLTASFSVGPLLFVVVHAYVLLHFVLLAAKVGVFHRELQSQIADEGVRTNLRRQLPSNIFAQFLAGPREVRTGIVGAMLRAIAWISLVFGPLALLVLFQLQFLPYQEAWITWLHRFALLADLILIWLLWPSILTGGPVQLSWAHVFRWKVAVYAIASFVPIYLVFVLATLPAEFAERYLLPWHFIPSTNLVGEFQNKSLHEWLIAGEVDPIARKPTSLWSNRLVLPGLDVIDHTKYDGDDPKLASLPPSLSLRSRRLERAILSGANLRKADFAGAILTNASLDSANLEYAVFDGANLTGVRFDEAKLNRASLQGANVQAAMFLNSQLRAVRATGADMRGSTFVDADLAFAQLRSSRLDGSVFSRARLDGADLMFSSLSGVALNSASMKGVNLKFDFGTAIDFEGAILWRLRDGDGLGFSKIRIVPPSEVIEAYVQERWNREDLREIVERYFGTLEKKAYLQLVDSLKCGDKDGSLSPCNFDSPTSIAARRVLQTKRVGPAQFVKARLDWLSDVCRDPANFRFLLAVVEATAGYTEGKLPDNCPEDAKQLAIRSYVR